MTTSDITAVYYTSNWLDDHNPYFLANTRKYLLKALDGIGMVIVSQKPTLFGPNSTNVVVGDIGRSHLNIYRQILEGCKAAKTTWVAMAEDDILYSWDHFRPQHAIKNMKEDTFYYDMNKVSLFTWSKPPIFSFRSKRMVVNHLIAPRQMLIDAMEERFARLEVLKEEVRRKHPEIEDPERNLLKFWGDPGRYEDILGVTVRKTEQFYSWRPGIVFSHEEAYGYVDNQGKKKRHGDLRMIEICDWGRAEDIRKLYYERE